MPFRLSRTKQCAKCPWKVSTDPHQIPNGYDIEKHRGLARTIAAESSLAFLWGGDLHVMACHEHPVGDEAYCVGWLMHQLGPGNNIALRLHMRHCDNLDAVRLDGAQHQRFQDTLPRDG